MGRAFRLPSCPVNRGQLIRTVAPSLMELRSATRNAGVFSTARLGAVAFLVCDVLVQSHITVLLGDAWKTGALAVELALIILSIGIVGVRLSTGRVLPALVTVGLLGLIFLQMFVFVYNSNADFMFTGCGQYLSLCATALFTQRRNDMQGILRFFAFLCMGYLLLYIELWSWGNEAIKLQLRLNDIERGERLFLASMYGIFVLNCGLRAKAAFSLPVRLFFIAVSIVAITMSQSRFPQFIMLLSIAGNGFRVTTRPFTIAFMTMFVVISTVLLFGLFDPYFNPYAPMSYDSSAYSRVLQFEKARTLVWEYPFFGVGLVPNPAELSILSSMEDFYSTDLGITGLWVAFGLYGIVILTIIAFTIGREALFHKERDTIEFAVLLTAVAAIGYSVLVPLFYASSQIFVAISLALIFNRPARDSARLVTCSRRFGQGRNWNFPLMIPRSGRREFHEVIEVHGSTDRLCSEAG